jgi:maltooligosyltrehalose synthase
VARKRVLTKTADFIPAYHVGIKGSDSRIWDDVVDPGRSVAYGQNNDHVFKRELNIVIAVLASWSFYVCLWREKCVS